MSKIVIGIDPDSDKHGVAIYEGRELTQLLSWDLMDVIAYLDSHLAFCKFNPDELEFHIEDVCANNFVYARNNKGSKAATSKIAMAIGRCQQSQVELMRLLDKGKIKYVLHKPQKGNWAKNKKQFELVTGWTGRSNEDTRSAAYFGYLGLKQLEE